MSGSHLDRPIALVGMPGAGKSTVGRLLAARIALPFVDSDALVVGKTGRSIEDIFFTEGQAFFRALEREVLAEALAEPPAVIATGGGAMVEPATRALLLGRSLTIWLDVSPATLMRRLANAPARPLLSGPNVEAKLTAMAQVRREAYAQANLRIAADDDAERVCALVLAVLG